MFKADLGTDGKPLPNFEHWNWGECVFGYDKLEEIKRQFER
jgi:hypothetical protein